MNPVPRARYAPRLPITILTTLITAGMIWWGTHHMLSLLAAYNGETANPLALTWAVTFLLLWWIVLSWFETPYQPTTRQQRQLDGMTVTCAVPVFNEPPDRLERCLSSLLAQTRPPNRIHVVDDGTTQYDYEAEGTIAEFMTAAHQVGVEAEWSRQPNAGKRHAQMLAFAHDDADIYLTCDSDTVFDERANEEGLKPFANAAVHSVAGMVAVLNSHGNWLARLTCMLYTPFTRGFRSAQSVLGQVMVNSGTLAWYRGDTIRRYARSYPRETFRGRPMQMNDDSMMTLYGLTHGRAVHQPTAVAYTYVPEHPAEYLNQQLRWMRGTFVRQLWWWRYLPVRSAGWWMPIGESAALLIGIMLLPVLLFNAGSLVTDRAQFWITGLVVAVTVNYVVALRYFVLRRSDETMWHAFGIWLIAPLAGVWRLLVLRPLIVYAYCTFWRVGKWGTRGDHALVDTREARAPEMVASI